LKDKRARLLELITEIQEIYPKLDRLMLDDPEDPDQIIIASEERITEIAEEAGLDVEFLDSFFDDDDDDAPFDFDEIMGLFGDDDDDKGTLQ